MDITRFFKPINADDTREQFPELFAAWRRLAKDLDYHGPVAWRVQPGFSFLAHALKATDDLSAWHHMSRQGIVNDVPTQSSVIFWVPCLVPEGIGKTVAEQQSMFYELRQKYGLPTHHLASFGSASLLSGLLLSRYQELLRKEIISSKWAGAKYIFAVRTDTVTHLGSRVIILGADEEGVNCESVIDNGGGYACGFFPLGIEYAVAE